MTMIHLDRKAARQLKLRHDLDKMTERIAQTAGAVLTYATAAGLAAVVGDKPNTAVALCHCRAVIDSARLLQRHLEQAEQLRQKVAP